MKKKHESLNKSLHTKPGFKWNTVMSLFNFPWQPKIKSCFKNCTLAMRFTRDIKFLSGF